MKVIRTEGADFKVDNSGGKSHWVSETNHRKSGALECKQDRI